MPIGVGHQVAAVVDERAIEDFALGTRLRRACWGQVPKPYTSFGVFDCSRSYPTSFLSGKSCKNLLQPVWAEINFISPLLGVAAPAKQLHVGYMIRALWFA